MEEIDILKHKIDIQTTQINELSKIKHSYLRAVEKIIVLESKIESLENYKCPNHTIPKKK